MRMSLQLSAEENAQVRRAARTQSEIAIYMEEKMTKYVFVTGGVVSGLGKGITAASLGRLLKKRTSHCLSEA